MDHKYFRIGVEIAHALSNWGKGTAGQLVEAMARRGVEFEFDQVGELLKFVTSNRLCIVGFGGAKAIIDQPMRLKNSR